jgi:enamine deaminase RidA (YjgF/YER057c/UK114 family)
VPSQSRGDRSIIHAPSIPQPPGWSSAVKAGGWVFVAGTMATNFESGIAPAARLDPRRPYLQDELELQSIHILATIDATLRAAGCDMRRDLIRVWQWAPGEYPDPAIYEKGPSNWPRFRSATPYARQLSKLVGDPRRSSTGIGVRELAVPEALLAVDLIAVEPGPGLEKEAFRAPPGVPQPAAGYSPATRYGDWVFLAGFGATDFCGDWMSAVHMGEPSMIAPAARVNPYIWLGSEIEAQTEYTLQMLAKIAEAAGTSLDRCVKADVTITHPNDFMDMDRVWRKWFPDDPPARNVVTGAQLVIKGLRIEIALLLLAGDSPLSKRTISASNVPPSVGHAPQAVRAGDFLFLSTQLPIDHDGAVLPQLRCDQQMPYFDQYARRQADTMFERIASICAAGGTTLDQVCKVQAFFDDLRWLPEMLESWRSAFPLAPPAFTAVGMGGGQPLLVPGAHLQMDVIAFVPPAVEHDSSGHGAYQI